MFKERNTQIVAVAVPITLIILTIMSGLEKNACKASLLYRRDTYLGLQFPKDLPQC
jgi:hypothetical protein